MSDPSWAIPLFRLGGSVGYSMRSRRLLLLVPLLFASPSLAENDTTAPRRGSVLSVRGTGTYEQKPDFGRFTVAVVTRAKTLEAVSASHEERATRAISALKAFEPSGLTIESSTFSVSEERIPRETLPLTAEARSKLVLSETPFRAATRFKLKAASLTDLNGLVSRLADTGLLEVQDVAFGLDKERSAYNSARREAMLDARDQAQAYADAGDLKLVEITNVTDGEARSVSGGEADMPRRPLGMPVFVQIIPPARLSFEASVNVTWRIAPR